jgi:hypothetical protein
MSGILLPGQENRPSAQSPDTSSQTGGGSGLVLPSSARRRPEAEPTPPAAPDIETVAQPEGTQPPAGEGSSAQGPDAGAPRGQRRLSAEDLLFPPTGAQVQCPNCGTPFVVPIFSIIDLGANPELKQMLLSGQINAASCPRCGAGGALSTPLMVHVPDKQWLGVVTPAEARINEVQRQKVIGEMTQALMRKLPQDERKGYMLQPRQYMDWNRFLEQLWEFEGVTAEMLRRQRAQTDLLQSLLSLSNDRDALQIAINRNGDLIDRSFFNLLDRMYLMLVSQPGAAQGEFDVARFTQLREALLEMTPAGQEVAALQERVRVLVEKFQPGITRDELLQTLLDAWEQPNGREVVGAVVVSAAPAFDYEFMLRISERMEQAGGDERVRLEELRAMVMAAQERLQQTSQAAAQEASALLSELLQAPDLEQALRANIDALDENFLGMLAASIQQAERNNSKGAVRRLRQVYDTTLRLLQEGLPDEMRLINELLSASENRGDLKRVLEANRDAITPEFLDLLHRAEDDMRAEGRDALADRVKSIRGQATLMM